MRLNRWHDSQLPNHDPTVTSYVKGVINYLEKLKEIERPFTIRKKWNQAERYINRFEIYYSLSQKCVIIRASDYIQFFKDFIKTFAVFYWDEQIEVIFKDLFQNFMKIFEELQLKIKHIPQSL